MSLLALQVYNKWKVSTNQEACSNSENCGAVDTMEETNLLKREVVIKSDDLSSFTILKRTNKARKDPIRVTYQDGASQDINDQEGSNHHSASDETKANASLQTWSRIKGLKRKEIYSSLSIYAAAEKNSKRPSRHTAFPSRSQGSNKNHKIRKDNQPVKKIKRIEGGTDINENIAKTTLGQATSDSYFCEDKFYDEDIEEHKAKVVKIKEGSVLLKKSNHTLGRKNSEKRKKEVDDFKSRRREERDQKLRRQEEEQKARVSFNKIEYKQDLDNDSKKIKEVAKSLKFQDDKSDDGLKDLKTSSPKRHGHASHTSRHRDDSEDRDETMSRSSRSRDRSSRGDREIISGIHQLPRSKSSSRSRSPRKRRRKEKESRNNGTHSKSKAESKSASLVAKLKESWKEVDLFNVEFLKSSRDPNKSKKISRVPSTSGQISRERSKSCSDTGSTSKTTESNETNFKNHESQRHGKKVTWANDENLVMVKFFEVIEEERGNVFKKKFAGKRKLEAKKEKLKLAAAGDSEMRSFENGRISSRHGSANHVSMSSWPALRPLSLSGLRSDVMIGSGSLEKLIQRAREAQVQPLSILPGAEPTEAETVHQRRSILINYMRHYF